MQARRAEKESLKDCVGNDDGDGDVGKGRCMEGRRKGQEEVMW